MNGIIGMADLLLDGGLDDEKSRFAETIRTSAEALLRVINDILDYSKLEGSDLALDEEPGAMTGLIEDLYFATEALSRRKGLTLRRHVDPEARAIFIFDPLRLRQVLMNLIDNAIKFTTTGEIGIEVSVTGQQNDAALVRFVVSDTGIGIAEDRLQQIFDSFSQADSTSSRRYGGTGLGLAISKRIVDRMHGSLEVSSRPGVGSRFSFTIPLRKAAEQWSDDGVASAVAEVAPTRSLDILVVEDDAINQQVAYSMLTRMGHRPQIAAGGDDAVDMVRHHRFDLIFMDLRMPNRDGLATARAIRALEGPAGRTLIVAMTADTAHETREMVLDAGMDDFISKPVNRELMSEVILRWQDRLESDAEGSTAPPASAAPPSPPDVGETIRNRAAQAEIEDALGPEAYRTLMANFCGMLHAKLDRVVELLGHGEIAKATALVHSLLGSATNLGFTALGLRLEALELELKVDPSGTGADSRLGQVRDAARAIIAAT